MSLPTVFADFQSADPQGRLRLTCVGTLKDLARLGLVLTEGLRLILSDRELWVEGEVHYSPEERSWVAAIDWDAIQPLIPDADTAESSPAA